ncbi:hypothetical protein BGZ82_006692 [Podila clonocystis]|nr:hypothetical protein BGZ82_006692 [Podila clonocystis]
MSSQKRDYNPSRPVSMLGASRQNSLSQSFNVKPITIRTNSMSLPGFAQPRAKSKAGKALHFAQQILLKFKRLHRIQTRRGLERNWYQIGAFALLFLFVFYFTRLFASVGSFQFTRTARLGPRMAETITALENMQYTASNGAMVSLDKDKLFSGVRRARLYQGTRIRRQIMDNQTDPAVRVVDADSLDEALRLKRLGFKPIVLDMANREFPGGEPRRSEFYPLPSQGAVYCPNMIVLRKSSLENDEFMDRPEWMSFLAMAPLRNPPLVANEANEMILGERAAIITKKKIQNMFRIALDNGHDAIVLSAFGCGRLHNPPESIARIFKQVIRSNYMGGAKKGRTFAEIVFAVTNYESSDSAVNDSYNHDTFKRVMESPDDISNEDEVEI